ncbi:PREDICTED: uncharacterized protein LOC108566405, partial [Nicrophorus vespilloides]|uniref:Uncharacterized protein LOC108566405 n=1 Tax=Nicrophorus vespilloides TaxID=110193 RepID=A0ABM1N4K4_NICVS
MPVPRKQRKGHRQQVNGLYVHSSPPRVLQINSAHIRQAIRSGDIEKLENIVYDGQGKKLIGEYASDYKVRSFLKTVPSLMSKISLLHDAVNSGRLEELQSLLDEENEKNRKKLVLAKDESGVGLLHKAVYYDLKDISEWILKNYPSAASLKDTDGRTAFHYTPMCQNPGSIQKMLKSAGADPSALDNRQRSARYYADHISELELPNSHKSKLNSRRNTTVKDSKLKSREILTQIELKFLPRRPQLPPTH